MKRQHYNRKILAKLSKAIEQEPDLRFGQLLQNIGIVIDGRVANVELTGIVGVWHDEYYLESQELYNRVKAKK